MRAGIIKTIPFVSVTIIIFLMRYRKIPRISPGTYIFQKPFLRGLYSEGNLRFKIDWASHVIGSKFTVFALFYFVFEGNFPRRGNLTDDFLRYRFGGLIFGGAYFRNFTVLEDVLKIFTVLLANI